ncbi:MAG: glycosyltransferase family 4 protein, partial [Actinobacteria bacterium]|nr:glycosyltransferase family 4 protein [Actinomycetota bacterium]
MRLGIEVELVGRDGSGNETYLREMVRSLQEVAAPDDEFILAGVPSPAVDALVGPRARVVPVRRGLRGDLTLGRTLAAAGAKVAVATYNAPLAFGGTKVTFVHDVAFKRVPETFPGLLRRRIALSVGRSVRVSDLVVTLTEFSKAELCATYPRLAPERVVVTYAAAADDFSRPRSQEQLDDVVRRFDLPDRFVLAVGNLQPRKNLVRLLEATQQVGVPLVATGQAGWLSDQGLLTRLQADAQWLGRVSTDDLACLYRLCTVFAYPSLYEGFGLPVVEAMASGAVVVTSRTTALGEVAGDGAILVDPTSADDIAVG